MLSAAYEYSDRAETSVGGIALPKEMSFEGESHLSNRVREIINIWSLTFIVISFLKKANLHLMTNIN